MRPTGRHPIRDNETKTNNLKSVTHEEEFEDLDTLEMQRDKTIKVLGAGGDGSIDSGTPAISVGSLLS